jgi:hypothetical protein
MKKSACFAAQETPSNGAELRQRSFIYVHRFLAQPTHWLEANATLSVE